MSISLAQEKRLKPIQKNLLVEEIGAKLAELIRKG
jgi:hypothetical protein